MPAFLNDVHLFEKVLFIVQNADKMTEDFGTYLMSLNNMYVRAKPDPDFINEFPMNIFFAYIEDVKDFFKTHLNIQRGLFPQIKDESGAILP
jgi:hypothetical protein